MHRWTRQSIDRLGECLAARGFKPDDGPGCYRLKDLGASAEPGWIVFNAPAAPGRNGVLGDAGLWKRRTAIRGQRGAARAFDLPLTTSLVTALHNQGEDDALLAAIDWAVASARADIPADWRPPALDPTAAAALVPAALSLRVGPLTRAAQLVRSDQRFALRLSISAAMAPLDPSRRRWLDTLAADAAALRMVRVECSADADRSELIAEVDLSGAPAPLLAELIPAGLAALRLGFARLANAAELLTSGVECRLLEVAAATPGPSGPLEESIR